MKKRKLGSTDLELSELGFGCSGLWGKNIMGKPAISEEQAIELFITAFESGINFFDTGFNYGYAEERLGKCIACLQNKGYKRSDIIIETKFGEKIAQNGTYGKNDYSSEWAKRSLEISLKRLNTDYIDMYALHGGQISDLTYDLINTLQDFKNQGIIRSFGINSFDNLVLEYICKEKCFEYVMLDYNILRQDRENLIHQLYKNKIGVIGGAALAESLFSNRIFKVKNKKDLWYLLRAIKNFKKHISTGRNFRFLTQTNAGSGSQLALRYVLDNPNLTSAVFTTTNLEHLKENIKACDIELPSFHMKKIKEQNKHFK